MKKVKVDYEKRKVDPNNPNPQITPDADSSVPSTLMLIFYAILGFLQVFHV